ncbi:MAG: hypothetical protein ACPGU3_07840 [Litorivicinus sp.]
MIDLLGVWFVFAPVMILTGLGALISEPSWEVAGQVALITSVWFGVNALIFFGCRWLWRWVKRRQSNPS